jgi:hypothetical protein
MVRAVLAVMAACGVVASPVEAACWNKDEVSAANVRELQSMLMVTALRCQVAGHGMMGEYNSFVVANRGALGAMNDRLKAHFIHAMGPVEGQRAYDSFTTSMANEFGAASSGGEVCGSAASLAREGALMAGSLEGLLLLADRQGLAARIADGACSDAPPITLASISPTDEAMRH